MHTSHMKYMYIVSTYCVHEFGQAFTLFLSYRNACVGLRHGLFCVLSISNVLHSNIIMHGWCMSEASKQVALYARNVCRLKITPTAFSENDGIVNMYLYRGKEPKKTSIR